MSPPSGYPRIDAAQPSWVCRAAGQQQRRAIAATAARAGSSVRCLSRPTKPPRIRSARSPAACARACARSPHPGQLTATGHRGMRVGYLAPLSPVPVDQCRLLRRSVGKRARHSDLAAAGASFGRFVRLAHDAIAGAASAGHCGVERCRLRERVHALEGAACEVAGDRDGARVRTGARGLLLDRREPFSARWYSRRTSSRSR